MWHLSPEWAELKIKSAKVVSEQKKCKKNKSKNQQEVFFLTFPLPPEENVSSRSFRQSVSDEQKQDVSPFQINQDSFFIYTAPSSLHPVLFSFGVFLRQQQLLSCRAIRSLNAVGRSCLLLWLQDEERTLWRSVRLHLSASSQSRHHKLDMAAVTNETEICCWHQLSLQKKKLKNKSSAKTERRLEGWLWTLPKNLFVKITQEPHGWIFIHNWLTFGVNWNQDGHNN